MYLSRLLFCMEIKIKKRLCTYIHLYICILTKHCILYVRSTFTEVFYLLFLQLISPLSISLSKYFPFAPSSFLCCSCCSHRQQQTADIKVIMASDNACPFFSTAAALSLPESLYNLPGLYTFSLAASIFVFIRELYSLSLLLLQLCNDFAYYHLEPSFLFYINMHKYYQSLIQTQHKSSEDERKKVRRRKKNKHKNSCILLLLLAILLFFL